MKDYLGAPDGEGRGVVFTRDSDFKYSEAFRTKDDFDNVKDIH